MAVASNELTLTHCIFVGNSAPKGSCLFNYLQGIARLNGCIFWNNDMTPITGVAVDVTFSDIQGGYLGQGNMDVVPCFVDPGYWDTNETPEDPNDDFYVAGDYHLKSEGGHWDLETKGWLQDDVTRACIDTGDPNSPIGLEPFPNGGVVNMGAYGGAVEASKSYFGEPVCETIVAGDVNGDCRVDFEDLVILMRHWTEF